MLKFLLIMPALFSYAFNYLLCGIICQGLVAIRDSINRENFNPRIPGICVWDENSTRTRSRRDLGTGARATAKILTAKNGQSAKNLPHENIWT